MLLRTGMVRRSQSSAPVNKRLNVAHIAMPCGDHVITSQGCTGGHECRGRLSDMTHVDIKPSVGFHSRFVSDTLAAAPVG